MMTMKFYMVMRYDLLPCGVLDVCCSEASTRPWILPELPVCDLLDDETGSWPPLPCSCFSTSDQAKWILN